MSDPARKTELVGLSFAGDIAVITINNPPVNALSPGVPEGIAECLKAAVEDGAVRAIVLIGGGRTFISGADIKEFGKITSGLRKADIGLNDYNAIVENSPKPVTMAIHGNALGGGLEIAMAGAYRVISPDARVGQPEVKLGLIPGAGGTQRLPRLAGIAKACEMCWQGDSISAKDALAHGIVDRIIEGDLLTGAIAFARDMASSGVPAERTRDKNAKLGGTVENAPVLDAARKAAAQRFRMMHAPQKAIDAVEAAARLPFDQGLALEREWFEELLFGSQSKSMIHVFFGEREVAKVPGLPKETPVLPIAKAAVVGAGTMGGGIAMNYVNAGVPVILKETTTEALDRGLATIRRNYANSVAKGRFPQEWVDQRLALLTPTLSYDGFDTADIVVEAAFENMALKKELFAEIEKVARPGAILATNTSTLDIDEIASVTSRPEFVIGHHFFSPANVMRLLEVVRGSVTSPEVIATSMDLAKKLKKVGVLVGNCFGFVGNRMFGPYRREAQFLVEEGASIEQVDAALYEWGMAMGPLAVGDLAGLDVGWRIRNEIRHTFVPGDRQPMLEDKLCEMGRYGQKTGGGWYAYDAKGKPSSDPAVGTLIDEVRRTMGFARQELSADEIVERTVYALINEGARILEEGIAARAVDIDIVYVMGYGFPAWRGGPMFYADTVGLDKVLDRIQDFEQQHGDAWAAAPLLVKLANEGGKFTNWRR